MAYGLDKGPRTRKFWYTTWAAVRSTYPCWRLATALSKCWPTNGNNRLGGDDFDDKIVKWMVDEFKKSDGIDLGNDKIALQRLKEAAEKAKIELSGVMQTNINLPFITADASGPKHLDLNLTRSKFDELTADLVAATEGPTSSAIKDAGIQSF